MTWNAIWTALGHGATLITNDAALEHGAIEGHETIALPTRAI